MSRPDSVCGDCGSEMQWVECWNGCEDGWFDGYENDPNWYGPGETFPCSQCRAQGGWFVCFRCSEQPAESA